MHESEWKKRVKLLVRGYAEPELRGDIYVQHMLEKLVPSKTLGEDPRF